MTLARELIMNAQINGADLVKFQLYDHNKLYSENAEIPNVELSFEQAKMLFEYGEELGIEVFFSVFDVEKVEWCEKIGVKRYKIAFSQNQNLELWNTIVDTNKDIIISCSTPYTVPSLHHFDCNNWFNVSFLKCIPKYPALIEDLDFPDRFEGIGLSDHTIGLDAAKIALARNAQIIEKHFAFDHKTGIDAPWSMDYSELKELKRFENVCKTIQAPCSVQ